MRVELLVKNTESSPITLNGGLVAFGKKKIRNPGMAVE